MEYIKNCDYDYIKNKYPPKRFTRNDGIFDPDSGMAPDDIIAGIIENDALYSELSHPVRKARALEYVLIKIGGDGYAQYIVRTRNVGKADPAALRSKAFDILPRDTLDIALFYA